MRVGILARNTLTGLGSQTLEVHRHLQPSVTVIVDPGPRAQTPPRLDWFPGGTHIAWDRHGRLPGAFEAFIGKVDVVWTAESFYDRELPVRLAGAGIGTVLHANPELYDNTDQSHWATTYWTPTGWLPGKVPEAVLMPMPCPVDRYPEPTLEEPLRIVHPTARAMADRHGTKTFLRIVPRLAARGWTVDLVGPGHREVRHYWERDPGAAVMVLPRKYGGLSLPVLEALSAGVPVIMPDIPPNHEWPVNTIPATRGGKILTKGGYTEVWDVTPTHLEQAVVSLLSDPDLLMMERMRAYEWAQSHSWERLLPLWSEGLERARLI